MSKRKKCLKGCIFCSVLISLQMYEQAVKHFLPGQQEQIAEVKTGGVVAAQLVEKEQAEQESKLQNVPCYLYCF